MATTASTANIEWVKNLGADVAIDYKRDDFETVLRDYDVVLDSRRAQTLQKPLRVLKPGGIAIAIGIGGPPDPAFAKQIGANPAVRLATVLLSARTRLRARRRHVRANRFQEQASARPAMPCPEGPVDPVCDLGIAINDEAGDGADEPSIDGDRTGGRLWQRLDLRQVDIERSEWAALLDALTAALTSPGITGPLADIAGIDPIEILQPGDDPSTQIDLWVTQMAIDAGRLGMERPVTRWHESATSATSFRNRQDG